MAIRERLLSAKTETEFFVIMCSLSPKSQMGGIRTELKSVVEHECPALRLSITLAMRTQQEKKILLHWQTVYIISLDEHSTLTLQLADGKIIRGLQQIQLVLEQMWDRSTERLFALSSGVE